MRVLIDIAHPAHVHFFRQPIQQLRARGHDILITSRRKEIAEDLLNAYRLEHVTLSGEGGRAGLLGELALRDFRLVRTVRRWRPDVMAAIGGIFIAHAGAICRVPSLAFYDTENAKLQNALTYPLATRVIVPRCYAAWTPRARTIRYPGYHELSYLRPTYFKPDRAVAIANGLAETGATFLVRLVAWKANHDIGERGLTPDAVRAVVARLGRHGKVLLSSEAPPPADLDAFRYRGAPEQIHHVMAYCSGFFGESATMASECAVLGVPAVYAANTGRGYTDEQETRYGLVHNARKLDVATLDAAVEWLLACSPDAVAQRRRKLLDDTCDVAAFAVTAIEARGEIASPLPVAA
ncbi:MAG TPA: DUF354 domain-containing protein [Rhodanobacteraceae bacterium]|nr:DUF354 domain-containing protein [Rhodanobacteraceae bacterium]